MLESNEKAVSGHYSYVKEMKVQVGVLTRYNQFQTGVTDKHRIYTVSATV